jgi:uncharacterized membrane protein
MLSEALGFANVLGAGLLAGEEMTIRYGVRAPIADLDERPQILLRQSLIRNMRVKVPMLFLLTLASGAAAVALGGLDMPAALRAAGLLALLIFIAVTLLGTVPINKAALGWNAATPPGDWRARIARWERLDSVRTWAALAAFALCLTAMALR